MATKNKARLTTAATVAWSNGEPFDGYVLLQINLPSGYSQAMLEDDAPRLRVPLATPVKIRNGVVDQDTRAWFTNALVPPTTNYSAWWYDSNWRLISLGTELFSITTDPHTLTPPVLTVPTAASSSATPDETPVGNSQGFLATSGVPTRETPAGTVDGVNAIFTLSRSPSLLVLTRNGVVLEDGIAFIRSGVTITFQSGYIPTAGDVIRALLFG